MGVRKKTKSQNIRGNHSLRHHQSGASKDNIQASSHTDDGTDALQDEGTAPDRKAQVLELRSTGAFCFRGERLLNDNVTQSLIEHFEKWTPYVKKFGLLVIELHTIPPSLAASNIGKTAVTAYDGTHGYSDQYIVEYEVFLKAAEAAGLSLDPNHKAKYPPSSLATVSINLLRSLD